MAKRFEKAREYTEKYKNVLLPCKHCKSKEIIINSDRLPLYDNKNYWSVNCSTIGCDCTGFYTSVKEAVNRWNEMQGG